MSKEQLLETLVELRNSEPYDPEQAHVLADDALVAYINDREITNAFEAIEKWYS